MENPRESFPRNIWTLGNLPREKKTALSPRPHAPLPSHTHPMRRRRRAPPSLVLPVLDPPPPHGTSAENRRPECRHASSGTRRARPATVLRRVRAALAPPLCSAGASRTPAPPPCSAVPSAAPVLHQVGDVLAPPACVLAARAPTALALPPRIPALRPPTALAPPPCSAGGSWAPHRHRAYRPRAPSLRFAGSVPPRGPRTVAVFRRPRAPRPCSGGSTLIPRTASHGPHAPRAPECRSALPMAGLAHCGWEREEEGSVGEMRIRREEWE